MKILQFVPYFIPYSGGQERYVYNLSKYLVKMGHEVHVITSNFPKSKRFEKIDGITVERYNVIARPLRNPIVPKFLDVPKRFNYFDIVHIHNEHAFSSLIAACAKRKKDFPLILTNHGQLKFGNYIDDMIEKIYMKTFGKKILESADAIAVNSISDKKFLSAITPEILNKIYIVHNAIDPEVFIKLTKEVETDRDIERKWGFILKSINILYVGRLIRRKGIEWLIKAMKIIRKSTNKKIKCILVGEGEDKNYFETLVRKHNLSDLVIFTGRISDKELIWFYRNSDIFVLPSLSEGLPTTILEAMYFGLPVVATDIPGNREHFKGTVVLVHPKNEEVLAKSILMLLEDENLRKQLSKTGRRLVNKEYTWDKISRRYEEIYQIIIKE